MMEWIRSVGRAALGVLVSLGHHAFFFYDLVRNIPAALRRPYLVVAQIHAIGNRSLLIIMASGMAVGFVLALQMYYALVTYGAAESLGLIVNLSLVRELGPVVTALLFAGRAGTSLTAEIGLMKAGEQLAAMEMMAIDPKSRVLAPRFLGGMVSMPVLAILFSAVGILGAYVVAVLLIGVDAGNFWSIMQSQVDVKRDVGNGIVKSMVFGVICTFVALYQGYETQATPEGVAYATTRTVVIASLGVLCMDFVLTAMMFSTP
jgi:phospholipid/cholesterol/gamma-HCH transport system permease protein